MSTITLRAEPLAASAFAAFGEVVEGRSDYRLINRGTAQQYADLAQLDVDAAGGKPRVSLYRAKPRALPFAVEMLERHPLSSQLFMPLAGAPFLVVVAPASPGVAVDPADVRAFVSDGRQGVNYRRGIWHHPLIALERESDFLVLDRAGSGENCDEFRFGRRASIVVSR
jgi:ureidoglycolate lyase